MSWRAVVPVLMGALVALIPPPRDLSPNAWSCFALFTAVIIALITEPIPGSVVGIVGVTLASTLFLVHTGPRGCHPMGAHRVRRQHACGVIVSLAIVPEARRS